MEIASHRKSSVSSVGSLALTVAFGLSVFLSVCLSVGRSVGLDAGTEYFVL